MPKGFSEKEKEWIRNKLLEEGRKLFERYGIQKTTIDEIVKNVGISKGSFYLFYNSKEELFFEIIEKLEREFKENLLKEISSKEKDPKEIFRDFLTKCFEFMEKNPLLKHITEKEMEYLMRKLPEEKFSAHMNKDISQIIDFIIDYQNKGYFAKKDLTGIIGILKLMPYLIIHRDEFSEEEFSATKKILIDMLIEYL